MERLAKGLGEGGAFGMGLTWFHRGTRTHDGVSLLPYHPYQLAVHRGYCEVRNAIFQLTSQPTRECVSVVLSPVSDPT